MTTNLRPNDQRARIAVTLIWTMLALNIVALLSSYLQYRLLERLAEGEDVPQALLERNDLREQVIGLVFLGAYIICGIHFIRWFRRAYYNLHQLVSGLEESEGWAAGAWFVPFLNLYKPLRIMKELYRRTSDLLSRSQTHHVHPDTSILNVWWALWVASSIIGQITFRMSMNAHGLEAITNSTLVQMAANVVDIPLCLFAVRVIRNYAHMEEQLPGTPSEMDTLFPSTEAAR